jgi:Ribonuclease G/E
MTSLMCGPIALPVLKHGCEWQSSSLVIMPGLLHAGGDRERSKKWKKKQAAKEAAKKAEEAQAAADKAAAEAEKAAAEAEKAAVEAMAAGATDIV